MRKFKFNLQRLLDYRASIEEKLLAELAAVRAQYVREVEALAAAKALSISYRENMRSQLSCGDVEDIKSAHRYMIELARQVKAQELKVRQFEGLKDKKTAEVVAAAKDRKVLESLRENKVLEHRKEADLQEQKFLDDVASIRHNRTAVTSIASGGAE